MYNRVLKSMHLKRDRSLLSFAMVIILLFSQVTVVFADGTTFPLPAQNYVTGISFGGSHLVGNTSVGKLDVSTLTTDYQTVPVDTTFTIYTDMGRIFLDRGSWDPDTGTFSTTIKNSDLVQIQDVDGNVIPNVNVSNVNTDPSIQVYPRNPLNYDTNYRLVLKKYFTRSNKQIPPSITGAILEDVVIPFKTKARQNPTLTKAELRGSTLHLEGLTPGQNSEYNLAIDGQFDDANWKPFSYTDDIANIELTNVALTANSKIMVGYANADNSTPTVTSAAISVEFVSTSAPSFTEAVLSGNNLVLNGLPKNAASMEYRLAEDGQTYSDWKDLSVTSTSASVSVDGLNLVQYKSLIQVRYKANAPWPASDIAEKSIIYGIGNSAPLTQGTDTILADGIKVTSVSLNTPGEGEANNVTVRDASGEKVADPDGMPNMGFFYGDDDMVKSAGGIYGFILKGAGSGDDNHVKITIPYNLPTKPADDVPDYGENNVLNDSKVAIYMLTPLHLGDASEIWQYWQMMTTTIDSVNHTATVDVTGFDTNGKDIILGVKYYVFPPENFNLDYYSRTATSITLNIFQGSSVCGTKEMVLQRVNCADPNDVKTVTLSYKDYPELLNYAVNNWILYTDNDPKPGVKYAYTILSVTDMLGNKSCGLDPSTGKVVDNPSGTRYATIDSMETLVKETQDSIYANLKKLDNTLDGTGIRFATGDSQNSVTQKILLPTQGIFTCGADGITWTSDRPDILKISDGDTEIHPPVDANGNPIKDGVTVNLTGTIKYSLPDSVTHQTETATGTVTVPVTVKWNIVNDEVIIGNEFLHNPNMGSDYSLNIDPTININTAAKFDDSIAKTIVFQHSIILKDKSDGGSGSVPQDLAIDGHGKTIKADFDGALFNITPVNDGSFTLKNVTIDMNHKTGPVLSAGPVGTKITFDNVKIINAENCQYGILLEAGVGKEQFIANNCQFPSFKVAAIAATTSLYSHTAYKNMPIYISIDNCTFDGGGNPGYGILNAFGNISVTNSIFKGYKGAVNTGWNASNDSSLGQQYPKDADGNAYFEYKGIPDGTTSAGIFVKEMGTANLSSNTISDCDNSILIWTGEKNFNFLSEKPDSSFTAYSNVDEFVVDSSTASQVIDYLLSTNIIKGTEGSDSNKVVIKDAADRYNPSIISAGVDTGANTASIPVWPSESKLTYSNVDETTVTISWIPATDKNGISSYRIYNNNDLIATVDGTVNSYKVEGLTPGIQQNLKVEAVNKDGKWSVGGPTAVVNTLPAAAPTWPEGSKVTVTEVGPTYVVLSWSPAQDKEKIRTYQITSDYAYWTPGDITSIRITDLKPNTAYTFNVKAEDESRLKSEPISISFTTTDGSISNWPQDSRLYASNITGDGVTLYWDAAQILRDVYPERSKPGQFYYRVYCNGKMIAEDVIDKFRNMTENIPPQFTYKVTGLSSNSNYDFKVEYAFKVQNSTEQPVWSTDGPALSVKTSDTTDQSINLYFTDNDNSSKWKSAISDIKLYQYKVYPATGAIELTDEGKSLKGKYSISSGKISVDNGAFDKAGDYFISIEADGYPPIDMMQTIATINSGSGSSGSSGNSSSSHSRAGGGLSVVNTLVSVKVPVKIKTDNSSNVVATLDASSINNNAVNEIQIQEPKPESKIQVQIPASAVTNGSAGFEIHTDSVKLGIPVGVVDLSSLSNGATVQVSKNVMPAADANALLANVPQGNKSIGKVFTFNMAVCDSSNNVVKDVHNFASGKTVSVTINLSSDDIKGMDASKISAFYFDTASKSWVDIGGSFDEKTMTYTFNTTHFTDFTIMEKSSNVKRLAGPDRIETSIAIAKEQFADKAPDAVVLTTANSFPDALSGEGLAYKHNAPMLLVNKSVNESKNVLDYITSTLSKDKNIYILGGAGVVGTDISDYLISQGYKVIRIAGNDRYETNQQIFDNLNVTSGTSMVLASGNGFADALSISSIAALKGYPVLLSGKDNLSTNVIKDITNIQPTNVYIIGGTGALSADVEAQIKNINGKINIVRLGGNDRYETSMKIVDYFNLDTDTISVASGRDFPDALSGALLAARKNSSILLVNNTDITKQKELLNKHGIKSVIIFGGEGVISSDAANSLIQK